MVPGDVAGRAENALAVFAQVRLLRPVETVGKVIRRPALVVRHGHEPVSLVVAPVLGVSGGVHGYLKVIRPESVPVRVRVAEQPSLQAGF